MKLRRNRSLVALVAAAGLVLLGGSAAAAGESAVSILGMAWTTSPAPALVVSASGPLLCEEARPEPGLTLLTFPAAVPAEPVAPVAEAQAGLSQAELEVLEDGGRRFARLRIQHDPAMRAAVRSLPAGVEIRFEALGAQPVSRDLSDLLAVADDTGVSVLMAGGGSLTGKVFTLTDPPRVVVDLPGVTNRVARRVHPVNAAGVVRVRVAQFATAPQPVVRVVVDLERDAQYSLESTAQGALLRVGGAPPPAVAAAQAPAESAPAVAEAAPVVERAPEPAPAEAVVKTQPVVAAAAPAIDKAPEPVTIVDEPVPAEAAAEQPPPAPAQAEENLLTPPEPAAKTGSRTVTPPPPPAESPWTSTPAAMAEQAPPATVVAGSTTEVESQEKQFTGEPISLELKDADIKDVLRSFSKITGLNIVVDPDVSGSVTVNLENVPWDQCLDIVLRINRLDYVVENNVLRVARIERLTQEKQQIAEYKRQEETAKPMRTVTKSLSYARAESVRTVLTAGNFILSERGSVVIDQRTNQLIIRDTADRIEGILALIDNLDQPNPQVIIEARIVETTRTFSRALGVQWGFTALGNASTGTTTGWKFPYSYGVAGDVLLAKPGNGIISMTFADILNSFNLEFSLQAAESNGLAKIVSSPKVTAQNNEQAHIQSGIQIPIQTVANNTVTVQYIDATLSLDVTPQITAEGTVMLDIDLKKREPLQGINLATAQNVPISTRDARTRVMVRDGGTTVIGGIYQFTDNDQNNSVPGLGNIPILGWLFKNTEVGSKHDELLIFITPRIVKY
jgi:type IV pilus assembly protein PilQ